MGFPVWLPRFCNSRAAALFTRVVRKPWKYAQLNALNPLRFPVGGSLNAIYIRKKV
jgi:hypothetical protein